MLEAMKGREKVQTENRRGKRKDDRRMRDLMNSPRSGLTLKCKHREKTIHQQRSSTAGLAQGGIKEMLAGRSSLGRVEAGGRRVRVGKSFRKSGE